MEQTILEQNLSDNMKNYIKLLENQNKYHALGIDIESVGFFNKDNAEAELIKHIRMTSDLEAELLNELISILLLENRTDYDIAIHDACSVCLGRNYNAEDYDDDDYMDEDDFDEELKILISDAGMLPFTLAMYKALDNTIKDLNLTEDWVCNHKYSLSIKLRHLHEHYSETNENISPALDVKDIVYEVLNKL